MCHVRARHHVLPFAPRAESVEVGRAAPRLSSRLATARRLCALLYARCRVTCVPVPWGVSLVSPSICSRCRARSRCSSATVSVSSRERQQSPGGGAAALLWRSTCVRARGRPRPAPRSVTVCVRGRAVSPCRESGDVRVVGRISNMCSKLNRTLVLRGRGRLSYTSISRLVTLPITLAPCTVPLPQRGTATGSIFGLSLKARPWSKQRVVAPLIGHAAGNLDATEQVAANAPTEARGTVHEHRHAVARGVRAAQHRRERRARRHRRLARAVGA